MSQRDTVLVYVGANQGNSLSELYDKFDRVYAFEPDPEMFSILKSRFDQFEWVNLINSACSDYDGGSKLYVTPNRVSSSLADASEEEKSMDGFSQSVFKVVDIKVVNLAKFLKREGVDIIDFYYSDCQGSDLTVLKTLKENFITPNKINQMFIETHGDGVEIYDGLNNQFTEFKKLLSDNFNFIHASLGSQNGKIVKEDEIPEGEKEWDSYWENKEWAE
jgi:FkbM family methyltransferase